MNIKSKLAKKCFEDLVVSADDLLSIAPENKVNEFINKNIELGAVVPFKIKNKLYFYWLPTAKCNSEHPLCSHQMAHDVIQKIIKIAEKN